MKRVLFLDFDGVLNSHRGETDPLPMWAHGWAFTWVSGELIRKLQPLLEVPDFAIVVSSTWRKHWPLGGLAKILNEYCPGLGARVIGRTPSRRSDDSTIGRGVEIREWLQRRGGGDVLTYAILDDDSDMLPEQMPFFVRTYGYTGVTDDDVARVADILRATQRLAA